MSVTFYRRKFSAIASGLCEEEVDKAGVWDFVERYQRMQCNCSRYKWHACFSETYQTLLTWVINIPIFIVFFFFIKTMQECGCMLFVTFIYKQIQGVLVLRWRSVR